jgi:hypothetical protein
MIFVRRFPPDGNQGAYNPRKEYGALISLREGIEVASQLLRQSDISTTYRRYHNLIDEPEPLWGLLAAYGFCCPDPVLRHPFGVCQGGFTSGPISISPRQRGSFSSGTLWHREYQRPANSKISIRPPCNNAICLFDSPKEFRATASIFMATRMVPTAPQRR